MTTTASVSAVIPCFRCVRTLERAVASVAGQTVLPQELILVDDGSSDGSFPLLKTIAGRDGRVRVIRFRRNFGQTAAMAAGFDAAQGRVVVPRSE